MKTRLIPFSIKKAKKGAKIVTREGRFPVRIVDYKIKDKYYPILALIEVDGREHPNTFTTNGKISKDEEDSFDLFIEVEEKEEEEVDDYNPYKATVESIAEISEMVDRNSDIDLRDFYDNVKVRCKEAVEYDKKWCKNQEEQKHSVNLKIMSNQWYICTLGWESCGWDGDWKFLEGFSYPGSEILQCYPMDKNEIQNHFHPWTIQDARNGIVLACDTCIVLFKEIDGLNIKCHCTYHFMDTPMFFVDTLQNKTAFYPATKEQRDILFQKIKEEGYEWDSDKKELHKIEEVKTRRMTNQELSWWLREHPEEHREYHLEVETCICFNYHYNSGDSNEEVDENIRIRRNGGEWMEPVIEIE